MEDGEIPDSPLRANKLKRRRPHATDRDSRAEACCEFAVQRTTYRSVNDFVRQKREISTDARAWLPSNGQMSRDMRAIFGADWARRRGGVGRARGGGRRNAENAPGLVPPPDAALLLNPCSKPTVLSSEVETRIILSVHEFETRYGCGIVTPGLIESFAAMEILNNLPNHNHTDWNTEEGKSKMKVILRQLRSVHNAGWLRSFLKRNKDRIRRSCRRRALELHKAAKHQIELVLSHFRNVYKADALAMIQMHMNEGRDVGPDFVRFEGIVQCTVSNTTENIVPSLLQLTDEKLIVKALNRPLRHIAARYRFALDETPIMPDSPLLSALTTCDSVPLSQARASVWTVLPVLRGDGSVVSYCVLQRCKSLPVDMVKFTAQNGICIGATENGQQTDDMWLRFAETWLPLCACSRERPGVVFIDGHSSHIRSEFIKLAASHGLYVVVEPSHTSMILQVADVGVNRFLKTQYQQEYTAALTTSSVTNSTFDDTERVACIVRTICQLRTKEKIIVNCFVRCGLLSGYNEVYQHFHPSQFSAGVPMRDERLPSITANYVRNVLSLKNLSSGIGAPVYVHEHSISDAKRQLRQYAVASGGFRKFYFSLGFTALTEISIDENNDSDTNKDDTNQNIRKLFRLGPAINVTRGAPGRVPTAYGSLASANDQFQIACIAERKAIEAKKEKEEKERVREINNNLERPAYDYLVHLGLLENGSRMTKSTIVEFLKTRCELRQTLNISLSNSRSVLVNALLTHLSNIGLK